MSEVINIQLASPPNLTTANMGDEGTIKLNNLPSLDSCRFNVSGFKLSFILFKNIF